MNLVASQFDKNDKSIQALSSRKQVLTKEIDAQKDKIATLQAAHKNAAESFGESDKRTQNWAIQLNNAKAKQNDMEREISANNKVTYIVTSHFNENGRETAEQKWLRYVSACVAEELKNSENAVI